MGTVPGKQNADMHHGTDDSERSACTRRGCRCKKWIARLFALPDRTGEQPRWAASHSSDRAYANLIQPHFAMLYVQKVLCEHISRGASITEGGARACMKESKRVSTLSANFCLTMSLGVPCLSPTVKEMQGKIPIAFQVSSKSTNHKPQESLGPCSNAGVMKPVETSNDTMNLSLHHSPLKRRGLSEPQT